MTPASKYKTILIQVISASFISCGYPKPGGSSPQGSQVSYMVRISGQTPVDSGFRTARIVPDILDTPPSALIKITYPSGVEVSMGNFLTPLSVKDTPSVGPWEANPSRLYTLVMLDAESFPDDVGNTVYYLHWLRFNIRGNSITTGSELVPYEGSSPPIDTGVHRYIFLTFLQPGPISPAGFNVPYEGDANPIRMTFNLRNFVAQHQLGIPISGNFFRVTAESSSATSPGPQLMG